MYRRYYNGFDRSRETPQRPIGDNLFDTNDTDDAQADKSENNTSSTNKPEIIVPEKPTQQNDIQITQSEPAIPQMTSEPFITNLSRGIENMFKIIKRDDLLILALLFILLQEEVEDELLILMLIFLFFIGF